MKRVLFQVHRWLGVLIGLYVVVVCVSGAALVFRIDLQRALDPRLFTPSAAGPLADPVAVMESVSRGYPQYGLSGVEAPTTRRPVYLAYVTKGAEFRTVLIDPVSAVVLGDLPERAVVRALQDLHYNLLGGRTGRTINGVGALAILILCATGLVVWWPGRRGWRRALVADFSRGRLAWQLHRAVGIWSVAVIALAAITGLAFIFPPAFRAVVNRASAVTVTRPPQSAVPADGAARPSWPQMLDRSRALAPGMPVARVVLPFGDRGAFLVQFADRSPTPAGSELRSIYLDQYSGDQLAATAASRTWGDAVMASMTPLHVGGVGGATGRWAWFLFGLAPTLLFITGSIAWWRRSR
jgi:uncharacterized iron-regulated membrane protein